MNLKAENFEVTYAYNGDTFGFIYNNTKFYYIKNSAFKFHSKETIMIEFKGYLTGSALKHLRKSYFKIIWGIGNKILGIIMES